jgi:hypothetical protein
MVPIASFVAPLLLPAALLAPPSVAEPEVRSDAVVIALLEQVGETQTDRDIAAIREQEGATLLTDPDTGHVVAAVSPRSKLGRALNPPPRSLVVGASGAAERIHGRH